MRQGRIVATLPTAETTAEQLAELMVGRTVSLRVDKAPARPGEPLLEVTDLAVEDALGVRRVKGVSFAVRRGEIVGVAGVAGNGQSELLEALAGIRPAASGQILWKARALGDGDARSPRPWRQRGLSHLPDARPRARLVALRDAGQALLVVSVELDEILALADRILVMHDGHIVGDVPRAAATVRGLGLMMAGVSKAG